MKKKFLAMTMALTCALAMAACGSTPAKESSSSGTGSSAPSSENNGGGYC